MDKIKKKKGEKRKMKDYLEITDVKALEILDSRGNPTIQVEVILERRISRNSICTIRRIHRKL